MTLKELLKNPPKKIINGNRVRRFSRKPVEVIDYDAWMGQIRDRVVKDRSFCVECGEPTCRAEVDSLWLDDYGPLCLRCYCKTVELV